MWSTQSSIMAALKEKRTCGQRCEDFGNFVWNSDHGTFMGRTPEKWGRDEISLTNCATLNKSDCNYSVICERSLIYSLLLKVNK